MRIRVQKNFIKRLTLIFAVLIFATLVYCVIFLIQYPIAPIHPRIEGKFPEEELWELQTEGRVISPVLIKDDVGYVLTEDMLYAFKVDVGRIIWTLPVSAYRDYSTPPEIFGDYLIFQNSSSGATLVSLTTKTIIWSCKENCAGIKYEKSHNITDFSLHDSILYIARYNSTLSAENILTGKTVWTFNLPQRIIVSIGLVDNKLLFTNDRKLTVLDLSNGSIIEEFVLGEFISNFFIEEGTNQIVIYTPLGLQVLTNYSYPAMELNWSIENDIFQTNDILTSDPSSAVFLNRNFIFFSNRIFIIDKSSGEITWFSEKHGMFEKPSTYENTLYSRNTNGSVFAIDLITGKTQGKLISLPPEQIIVGGPIRSLAINNNILIIPLGDNRIISYRVQ